ncbi:MAG: hypothetical protein OXU23_01895 [Candidatus Poribacteria bacterium]|nr:hypothetical protein [Candidatus Poribacteria bacterium]
MKLNILTSKLSIAIAALCIGDFSLIFQFVIKGFEFSFWYIGIYIGLWGGMSAAMIEWEKAKPDHPDIPKYKRIGNLTILFGFPFIVLLLIV